MGDVLQFPIPSCPGGMSGRDYLAMLIEDEKAYRASRMRYGIDHRRDVQIPLELAEALLTLLDLVVTTHGEDQG